MGASQMIFSTETTFVTNPVGALSKALFFGVLMLPLLMFPQQSVAQSTCKPLGFVDCANSEACMLDLDEGGKNYVCRTANNRCEMGYRQHILRGQSQSDDPQMRCELRAGCSYIAPAQCYCPKIEGVLCVCDGGRPHQCLEDAGQAVGLPEGTFTIVDLRRAEDVAGQPIPLNVKEVLGNEITLHTDGLELAGADCDDWTITATELQINFNSMMLRDALIGPIPMPHSSGDKRILQSWEYVCEGTDRFLVTQIDPNVVIFHLENGGLHAIAERPIAPGVVMRMQRALASVKFYGGPINGELDVDTLRGASFWAEDRLRPHSEFRFKRPALTMNLFDTMDVFE